MNKRQVTILRKFDTDFAALSKIKNNGFFVI